MKERLATHRVVTLVYRQSGITVKTSYPPFSMLQKLFFFHKRLLKSDLPPLKVQTIQKVVPPWFSMICRESSSLLWNKCWSVHGVFHTYCFGLGKTKKKPFGLRETKWCSFINPWKTFVSFHNYKNVWPPMIESWNIYLYLEICHEMFLIGHFIESLKLNSKTLKWIKDANPTNIASKCFPVGYFSVK